MRKLFTILLFSTLFSIFILDLPVSANGKTHNKIFLENIQALKSSDLKEGSFVKTLGYITKQDNGGADYFITSHPDYPVDDIFVIKTSGNKYAQMLFDQTSMINVACAGIFPSSNISDNLNKLISQSEGKVSGIQFNSGKYYLDKAVALRSLN